MKHAVHQAQSPLRTLYGQTPDAARVTNVVVSHGTDSADPFHTQVRSLETGGPPLAVGTHRAVGGPYDAPCPGDLLCAALAACNDSSIRMVADLMGIELVALEVKVSGTLDVRGAMGLARDVPVGFQSLVTDIHLQAREGTPPDLVHKLCVAAQRCCVVAHTLASPPRLETRVHA